MSGRTVTDAAAGMSRCKVSPLADTSGERRREPPDKASGCCAGASYGGDPPHLWM